jgi:predicted aldo/keto reductase-like oxidoreductase
MTMSLDEYVTLGRSGLRVSPFCLGAMTFGEEFGIGCDAPTAELILDHYIGHGGNFVDTANIYNAGRSEEIIGGYLARDSSRRAPPGTRNEVRRQHVFRRPEHRRRKPQGHSPRV